jgi:hypothetical protein
MVGEEQARDRSDKFGGCRDGAGCKPNLQSLEDDNSAKVGEEDTDRARSRVSIR